MATVQQSTERRFWIVASVAAVLLAGYAGSALSDEVKVTLTGNQEIPPVTTAASGTGTFTVGADKSVSGSVTISGMSATVAHIHEAAAGTTGPIIIPLTKIYDNVFALHDTLQLTTSMCD